MSLIAYPPVYDAKRIVPLRKSFLARKRPVSISQALSAQQVMENMNRVGVKTFRSRFMPQALLNIVKDVAQKRGVGLMLLAIDSRKRATVAARNEAMYLIQQARPNLTPIHIARWFSRDRTSVLHGLASHAEKNGLPQLVGYNFERVRARNARIAAERRAAQADTFGG